MPKNTGIYQHKEYIERLLREDSRIAGKDTSYGEYLRALTDLSTYTNEIYANGGQLTAESYGLLMGKYTNLAEKCVQYREKGDSKERRDIIDYIHKLISRDVRALNSMDKENPGKIEDAFEESRTVRVHIPEELKQRVGGQTNDRFPMKTSDGTRGFFTARSDAAQDKKWKEMIDRVAEKFDLTDQQLEKINKLKTDVELRAKLDYELYSEEEGVRPHALAVSLGMCDSIEKADTLFEDDTTLHKALENLVIGIDRLDTPLNLANRLGNDPYTRNDNKNAAMYDIAKLLGCEKLVAKAVPMVVVNGDKVLKGTFMEHAEGSDLSNLTSDDIMLNVDKSSFYNKELYSNLADLQILDYICGNIDRHKGNMIYKTSPEKLGKMKITGVIAIDNDASFPEDEINEGEFEATENRIARIYKPKNFRFVNEKTAEFVKSLTRGKLDLILRGHNISQKAIDLVWERTKEVQDVLSKMKENNISLVSEMYEGNGEYLSKEKDPFNTEDYMDKPSIFTKFNKTVTNLALHSGRVGKFRDTSPIGENLSREDALLVDIDKIARMDTRMDRVNRLKTPTKEFRAMRNAMFDLKKYSQTLRSKIIQKETLTKEDLDTYKEHLDALKEKTEHYISEKAISPRTANGRERLNAARSIENHTIELINNFEMDKNLEHSKKADESMDYDDSAVFDDSYEMDGL